MTASTSKSFSSAFVLFFLASIYPFLSFFEHNVSETYYFVSIFTVWAAIFLAGVLALLFSTKIWPKWSPQTGSLIFGIGLVALFSFHHVEKITADFGIYLGTIKISIWAVLVLALCVAGFFISRSSKLVTVILFMMLGMNLAPASSVLMALYNSRVVSKEKASGHQLEIAASDISEKPNVYWIITDMYARDDVLRDEYAYDNTPFLEDLRQRGFFVADKSYSNMNSTKLSVSTTLSMDYYLPVQTELNSMLWQNKLQGENPVVEKFRLLGYRYIHVEPGGNNLKTRCGGGEDLCLHGAQHAAISLNEAHIGLMRLTPFYRILKTLNVNFFSFDFTRIEDIQTHVQPKDQAPFFMMAHVLSPHPPARFDANCDYLKQTDWELLGEDSQHTDASYVQDVACLNKRLITFTDWVHENDPQAIVIIQGDHGSFLHTSRIENTPENIVKRSYWHTPLAIMNAYYVPEKCRAGLYDSISPINNFPFVFACIENKRFVPLPDRSFIQHRKPKFEKFHEEIYEIDYEARTPPATVQPLPVQ